MRVYQPPDSRTPTTPSRVLRVILCYYITCVILSSAYYTTYDSVNRTARASNFYVPVRRAHSNGSGGGSLVSARLSRSRACDRFRTHASRHINYYRYVIIILFACTANYTCRRGYYSRRRFTIMLYST